MQICEAKAKNSRFTFILLDSTDDIMIDVIGNMKMNRIVGSPTNSAESRSNPRTSAESATIRVEVFVVRRGPKNAPEISNSTTILRWMASPLVQSTVIAWRLGRACDDCEQVWQTSTLRPTHFNRVRLDVEWASRCSTISPSHGSGWVFSAPSWRPTRSISSYLASADPIRTTAKPNASVSRPSLPLLNRLHCTQSCLSNLPPAIVIIRLICWHFCQEAF